MSSSLMETGTTREGKPTMELMNCWRLRVDNFWELKIPGASRHKGVPTLLWVLLVAWPSSHSEYWRKLSLCFWQGEGKRNHTEMCQSILSILFSTRSVLKLARVLLLPNWHGVAESWTRLSDFTFTFHFHALEKEMAMHSSFLAWRIPGTGGAWWAAVYGVTQSRTRLKWLSSSSKCPLTGKWIKKITTIWQ